MEAASSATPTPTTPIPTTPTPTIEEQKALCLEGPLAWFVLIALSLLAIAAAMYLLRKCIQGPYYRKANRIDGKVAIVTGCNTGIGKETVLELARRGATVYMACRDAARCEAARLEIIASTRNENIHNRTLDLASLASVRRFADAFLREQPRLDLLINNAGIMATPRQLTVDGYEQQLATNHLGHFLLTQLLLDRLKASGPSRIVVVSSLAYLFGRINKKDLQSEQSYSKFFGAYAQSKLANILFTRALAERLARDGAQVTVNCCHPGVVRTELMRYNECSRCLWSVFWSGARFFLKSPKAGAQTSLRLALDPALESSTGGYYMDSMRWPLMPWATDRETAEWLWKESERLVGIAPSQPTAVETIVVDQP